MGRAGRGVNVSNQKPSPRPPPRPDKVFAPHLDGLSNDELKRAVINEYNQKLELLNGGKSEGKESNLPETLKLRRFNHRVKPSELRPIYTLLGKPVATPGNLVSVASAVKTGKSAVIGAMCASAMASSYNADLFGFESKNSEKGIVLWIDSEQAPDDFWHCVMRSVRRAGLASPPSWLHAYCLTGLQQGTAWECVKLALELAARSNVKIHSVLLDGLADLVTDPNDAAECNAFIAELHNLAIKHDCPIIGVIHFNPNSDKTRGHLGSQFERKSESNLRLDKDDDGVTEIWSEKQRRAPIPKGEGSCFQWSDDAGMHVSVENPSEAKAEARAGAKLAEMRQDALTCFAHVDKSSLSHSELVALIGQHKNLKPSGARRRLENWLKQGAVTKNDSGTYEVPSC